jgi:hypothetical protein
MQLSVISCQLPVDVAVIEFDRRSLESNRKVIMKSKTAQWIVWAVAMAIFTALTLSGHWNWLSAAITAVAVIWYSVVPKAHSRQQ